MLRFVRVILDFVFPVIPPEPFIAVRRQTSGQTQREQKWTPSIEVIWFNGFPGLPKLPLVQRRKPAASSLNPVASDAPEIEEGVEEGEDPEPLCRKSH
jgi:hypothetical protein